MASASDAMACTESERAVDVDAVEESAQVLGRAAAAGPLSVRNDEGESCEWDTNPDLNVASTSAGNHPGASWRMHAKLRMWNTMKAPTLYPHAHVRTERPEAEHPEAEHPKAAATSMVRLQSPAAAPECSQQQEVSEGIDVAAQDLFHDEEPAYDDVAASADGAAAYGCGWQAPAGGDRRNLGDTAGQETSSTDGDQMASAKIVQIIDRDAEADECTVQEWAAEPSASKVPAASTGSDASKSVSVMEAELRRTVSLSKQLTRAASMSDTSWARVIPGGRDCSSTATATQAFQRRRTGKQRH